MRRLILLPLLLIVALLAGCGEDDGGTTAAIPSENAPADTTAPTTAAASPCKTVDDPGAKDVTAKKPTAALEDGVTYTVTLQTNCGDIPIQLDQAVAPKTAASFAHLAEDGFFDGLTFHRIVPGFVIQGGDPEGTGTGGAGYSVTEAPPQDTTYAPGVVAMAKAGNEAAGTSSSQFFIVTGDQASTLPPDYAIVGKVTGDGMTAAEAIAGVETSADDRPVSPVVIEKATLTES